MPGSKTVLTTVTVYVIVMSLVNILYLSYIYQIVEKETIFLVVYVKLKNNLFI